MYCASIPYDGGVVCRVQPSGPSHAHAPDVNVSCERNRVWLQGTEIFGLTVVPQHSGLDDISAVVHSVGSSHHLIPVVDAKPKSSRPPVEQGQRLEHSALPDETLAGQKQAVVVIGVYIGIAGDVFFVVYRSDVREKRGRLAGQNSDRYYLIAYIPA